MEAVELWHFKNKNLLVNDVRMFEVIHRVHGPFKRDIFIFCFLKPRKIALCLVFSVEVYCAPPHELREIERTLEVG